MRKSQLSKDFRHDTKSTIKEKKNQQLNKCLEGFNIQSHARKNWWNPQRGLVYNWLYLLHIFLTRFLWRSPAMPCPILEITFLVVWFLHFQSSFCSLHLGVAAPHIIWGLCLTFTPVKPLFFRPQVTHRILLLPAVQHPAVRTCRVPGPCCDLRQSLGRRWTDGDIELEQPKQEAAWMWAGLARAVPPHSPQVSAFEHPCRDHCSQGGGCAEAPPRSPRGLNLHYSG